MPFSKVLMDFSRTSTVIRPPGVDLEGSPTALQEPYLNSTLGNAYHLETSFSDPWLIRKRVEYGFGEYGFKHRAQGAFWPSPSSGERTQ